MYPVNTGLAALLCSQRYLGGRVTTKDASLHYDMSNGRILSKPYIYSKNQSF